MDANPRLTKVLTGPVRLAHAHIYRPLAAFGQAPRFSAVILVPKNDIQTVRVIRAAQANALAAQEAKTGRPVPAGWKDHLRDGDTDPLRFKNPEYAGHWFMTASSPTPPGIVDERAEPIMDTITVGDGSLVRVSLNAFAYAYGENAGVSFSLNHIQKLPERLARAAA